MLGRLATAIAALIVLCSCGAEHRNEAEIAPTAAPDTAVARDSSVTMTFRPARDVSPRRDVDHVAATNRFAFDLYRELGPPQGNRLVSPLSLQLALSMTANGATGSTLDGMLAGLRVGDIALGDINRSNRILADALTSDTEVDLAIANSLWARQGARFRPNFVERNRRYYNARLTALDFTDPNTVPTINAWVRDNTRGRIERIVENMSPRSFLFLMNAVYFKGLWESPFAESATRDAPFTLLDGSSIDVPLMYRRARVAYAETELFQAAALPYRGGNLEMVLVLPRRASGDESIDAPLRALHDSLSAPAFDRWRRQLARREVRLFVPRFRMEHSIGLKRQLSALGMTEAFDPRRADFSEMLGPDSRGAAYIENVTHKTFLQVDEAGTVAAAATSIEISLTSAHPMEEPPIVKLDRPFLLVIRDRSTGAILFVGTLVDPRS